MIPNDDSDPISSNRPPSGTSSNSVKTKHYDYNDPVSEEKPKDDKNTYNNKDKDSSIKKEGRVGFLL